MTLSQAEISLDKIFCSGQSYVALSRIKSLEGLRLLTPVQANKFIANHQVADFYRQLNKFKLNLNLTGKSKRADPCMRRVPLCLFEQAKSKDKKVSQLTEMEVEKILCSQQRQKDN